MTLTKNIDLMKVEIASHIAYAAAAARKRQADTLLRLIAEAPKGGGQ